jgi:hypothetical protein
VHVGACLEQHAQGLDAEGAHGGVQWPPATRALCATPKNLAQCRLAAARLLRALALAHAFYQLAQAVHVALERQVHERAPILLDHARLS